MRCFPYDSNVDDDECLSYTLGNVDSDVKSFLEAFCENNMDKTIFAHLNIKSIRNKFDHLSHMIKGHIDVPTISESKLGNRFPDGQFLIERYSAPF